MADWMDFEVAFLGVVPQPYRKPIIVRPRSILPKAKPMNAVRRIRETN